jgi:arylformamidase
MRYALALAFAFVLQIQAAWAVPPTERRDVAYENPAGPLQRLDIYTPASGLRHPIVIWIHGGGWASGDKSEDMEIKPQAFADHGCVLVSANYRLLTKPGTPAEKAIGLREMTEDLAKAVKWVRDHAESFGGDAKSIFVTGHSAGAQLAALLCTDESYLAREGIPLSALSGCIPIDGDTYYPALQVDSNPPRRAEGYRRKFPDAAAQRDLSSLIHVAPGKGIPPFLLLHVTDFPETHTLVQAKILAQALTDAEVPVRDFGAPGRTHLTINTYLGAPGDEATRAMFEFIDAQVWKTSYRGWSSSIKLPAPAAATEKKRTLTYKQVGGTALQADVYEPTGFTGPRPVLVWIHGGALMSGSRRLSATDPLKLAMLAEGGVVVSIDYRLAPETKLPEIVSDVEDAFRWVREKGPELFSADPQRVIASGGSAGGYLALTAGFRVKPRPLGIVSFWGYGDLIGSWLTTPSHAARHLRTAPSSDPRSARYLRSRREGNWPQLVSGWNPRTEAEKFRPYLPLRNITPDYPPTLLIQGRKDTDVPFEQSVLMATALSEQGVQHALVTDPDADHNLNWSPAAKAAIQRAAIEFIRARLAGSQQ